MLKKNIIAVAISAFALIVSLFSVYWSQLRSADVEVTAGEWANAGYHGSENFWLLLPVTFTNRGAQGATVQKIALIVQTPKRKRSYLLESVNFSKLVGEKWVAESIPIPVAIPPGESIDKLVMFQSSEQNPNDFDIIQTVGSYPATLLLWMKVEGKPDMRAPLRFELSKEALEVLKKDRAGESGVARLYQSNWSRWRAKLLKDDEIQMLLE